MLLAYCDDVSAVARDLGLLPADEGANVALLTPFDRVVWERTVVDAGVAYAAPSQVAVDCLTGPGRMPAEGVQAMGAERPGPLFSVAAEVMVQLAEEPAAK